MENGYNLVISTGSRLKCANVKSKTAKIRKYRTKTKTNGLISVRYMSSRMYQSGPFRGPINMSDSDKFCNINTSMGGGIQG